MRPSPVGFLCLKGTAPARGWRTGTVKVRRILQDACKVQLSSKHIQHLAACSVSTAFQSYLGSRVWPALNLRSIAEPGIRKTTEPGNDTQREVLVRHHRNVWAVTGDRECRVLPPIMEQWHMNNVSEKYRLKALACEKLGRDATDSDTRSAWAEIAIEWHALASRMTLESSRQELGVE
jgi:hypothetical protein